MGQVRDVRGRPQPPLPSQAHGTEVRITLSAFSARSFVTELSDLSEGVLRHRPTVGEVLAEIEQQIRIAGALG